MAPSKARGSSGPSAIAYLRLGAELILIAWALYVYRLSQQRSLPANALNTEHITKNAGAGQLTVAVDKNSQHNAESQRRQQNSHKDAVMLRTLALSGSQCNLQPHTDIWGDAVVWGGEHHTASAAECCAACHAHRRAARERGALPDGRNSSVCNVFVHCGDAALCGGQLGECWLKHNKALPTPPGVPGGNRGPGVGWTAGVVYEIDAEFKAGSPGGILTLHTYSTLHTGPIRVELRPDLAPASVRELRHMAQEPTPCNEAIGGCGHFYRSEHHFLLQGVVRAPGFYVATPRHEAPPQQMVMERGLVCWAGGMGGPDFFINLIDQAGFKDSHLCWGKITDDMPLVDAIVASPLKNKAKPTDMTFLAEFVHFNLSLAG